MSASEVGAIARCLLRRYASAHELSMAYTCGGAHTLINMMIDKGALASFTTWCAMYRELEALAA